MIDRRRHSRRLANPDPANWVDLRSLHSEELCDRPTKPISELRAAWSKTRAGYTTEPLSYTLAAEPVRVVIATTAVSGG
jgi:hypothetical protein